MKVLTIVIPSYNTEKFIVKNMETFLINSIFEEVEILIINDGSKDRTAELASIYEQNYKGYIRLINKNNGGHGSVINRGVKEAQGKYFMVIDADDWVDSENLVRLVHDLKNSNADIIINPYMTLNQRTGKTKMYDYPKLHSIMPESSADIILKNNIRLTIHSVIYKTRVLQESKIMFTEKCFYEDFQYDLYPVQYSKTVTYLDYPVYWYLTAQKTQSVDASNTLKNVDMHFQVFCDMVKFYENNKDNYNEILDNYMKNSISEFLRSHYNIYLRNGNVKNIVNKFLKMDEQVKNYSYFFYNKVSENNLYIRLLQKRNKALFKLLSIALMLYKNI